tara:strand:+ start:345 stop:725 length:381 start_codon:yes stop_codon:yes gene_type:complete
MANSASTWTENASASNATATASHAAVVGKSHYITGIIVSCKDYNGVQGITLTVTVKDDTTAILEFACSSTGHDDYDPTGQPVIINFSSPIQITEGKAVSVEVAGATTYETAYANIWGFTSATRQED